MPALTYTSSNFPFQPFTKIYSADVNTCFTDIKTLLNTTKLTSTNVQVHGLVRNGATSNLAAGTANALVINDSSGDMSEVALGSPNQVAQVNPGGTAIIFGSTPPSAATYVYMYDTFTSISS